MKLAKHTRELDRILDAGDGIITTAGAAEAGVPKDAFYRYVRGKGLERLSHGVYRAAGAAPDELALLQERFPKAVLSHDTALFLHGLSEREPIPLSVSVPSSYNSPALRDQGVRIHYVKPEWHGMGVCEIRTPEGNAVRAYDMERTMCDIVRRRSKADVAEFNHAARTYAASKDRNLARLSEYARAMGMESRVWEALGVLL